MVFVCVFDRLWECALIGQLNFVTNTTKIVVCRRFLSCHCVLRINRIYLLKGKELTVSYPYGLVEDDARPPLTTKRP